MKKRILVTGASGCIGRALVECVINAGYEVTALALTDKNAGGIRGSDKVRTVYGDICDRNRMGEIFSSSMCQIVIHLAAIVHRRDATSEECMNVNYRATADLFELAKRCAVEQFIFASSAAVYGEDAGNVLNEESGVDPRSPYAASKYMAEEYIKYNHEDRIKYTIVRLATVYGKYDRGNIGRLMRIARRGLIPIVGDGNNRKSLVYVENVADGILKAVYNEKAYNEVFIISDGETYSINQIIKTCETVMNRRVVIIHIPAGVVLSVLEVLNDVTRGMGRKDLLKGSSVRKLVTNNIVDISKARERLKYEPRYNLEEGLRRIFLYNVESQGQGYGAHN